MNEQQIDCRASFKGEITKENFYILLKFLDDMKIRGWEFEKHERTNGEGTSLKIDYVLIKVKTAINNL